jgi:soluble lytic murein transglycosylase-like protein
VSDPSVSAGVSDQLPWISGSNGAWPVSAMPTGGIGAMGAMGAARPPMGPELERLIADASSKHGVPNWLIRNVIRAESGGNPQARSPVGAMGLMQLMPGTAEGLGVTDAYDAAQNVDGGTRYLRQLLDRFGGDTAKAVAAYNAGPGAVERYAGVPPFAETQAYVKRVLE